MFVMLWNLRVISHWIFHNTFFFLFLAPNLETTYEAIQFFFCNFMILNSLRSILFFHINFSDIYFFHSIRYAKSEWPPLNVFFLNQCNPKSRCLTTMQKQLWKTKQWEKKKENDSIQHILLFPQYFSEASNTNDKINYVTTDFFLLYKCF